MSKPKLPESLHAAHDWASAAGELEELASLQGDALRAYAEQSEANARDQGVTALDIVELAEWLQDTGVRS